MWVTGTPSSRPKRKEEKKKNIKAEPQTPPIVGSGSPSRKSHKTSYVNYNIYENKAIKKPVKNKKKSAFEILTEED